MRTNCVIWALCEWRRRLATWRAAGRPVGREPYLLLRPSRRDPRHLPHMLVGHRDSQSDLMHLESFKPDEPTDVPWWRAWSHIVFRGRVSRGDVPSRH